MDMSNYVQPNCINGVSKEEAEMVREIPQIQEDIDTITDVTIPAIQSDIDILTDTKIPAIQDEIDDLDDRITDIESSQSGNWVSVQTDEYTSTFYTNLFEDMGAIYGYSHKTLKDIAIYISAQSDSYTTQTFFFPKNTFIPRWLYTNFGGISNMKFSFGHIVLADLFGLPGSGTPRYTYFNAHYNSTNQTWDNVEYSTKNIELVTSPLLVGSGSKVNICIQYR